MEESRKFELKDEMLDKVAGGRDGWAAPSSMVYETKTMPAATAGDMSS